MKVVGYPSRFSAALEPVRARGGERLGVMATSTLPLRSRDRLGRMRLVDLVPKRDGDRFVPDNARVNLTIGGHADGGVTFVKRGVSIVPLDVRSVPGTPTGDAVLFANSATDADHIVRVTPAGADSLVQVRSTASPEQFRYRVDLPAGGSLRLLPAGDIAVIVGGRRVGMITKPTAWDADQRSIAVTSTLRGTMLTLDVAHRGRDVRYPLMVDPNYVDLFQYGWYDGGPNNATNAFWAFRTNDASKMAGFFGNYGQGVFGQSNGLYALTIGNQILNAGQYAYWTFTAPGTTSVLQAEWTHISHIEAHAIGPPPCLDYGLIYNTTAWRTHGLECANFTPAYRLSCWDCDDLDGFSYDPSVKGAQFGSGTYANTIATVSDYVGEVTIYLADPDDPTVTLTQAPSPGWTTAATGTIAATATDPGLGVRSLQIAATDPITNPSCYEAGPCAGPLSHSVTTASLDLPDGSNTVTVTARDASLYSHRDSNGNHVPAQHVGTASTIVRLDREKPTITPTGSLYDARDDFIGPNQDYTLAVTATDGSLTSPAAQRSGVTSLTATLDGTPMTGGSVSQPCTPLEGSCSLSINATLTSEQIEDLDETLPHTIVVAASDAVGHTETDSFTFRVDATPPTASPHGALAAERADEGSLALTGDSYELLADARDTVELENEDDEEILPPPPAPGSGVVSMELRIDGQLQQTTVPAECPSGPGCEKSLAFTWNTASVPSGPHTLEITTADAVGNVGVQAREVTIAHPTPQPPRANTLTRRIRGGSGMKAGTSVASLGDINADGRADYLVGAPGVRVAGRPAGAAYLVLGSSTVTDTDLGSADPTVLKISGPSESSGASYCGTAVAAAGDVNGDEIGDYMIGCPGLDTSDKLLAGLTPNRGRVFVVFGSATPQDVDLSAAVFGSRGFVVTGPQETAGLGITGIVLRPSVFGERLTSAFPDGGDGPSVMQDVNGDGLNDFVIGDARANSAHVVFGRTATSPVDATNLGGDGYSIVGSTGLTGHSAAIVEDITHDGLADTVIGAPGSTNVLIPGLGAAYIVPGSSERSGSVSVADAGQGTVKLTTGVAGDRFGAGVAGLGDTDLDGRADFAVATKSGALVVRTAPTVDKIVTAADGFAITSAAANTGGLLGTSVPEAPIAAAGDMDGDYRNDLVIGYPDAGDRRAYTIISPDGSTSMNASPALAGQLGSSVANGTTGDRSGVAVSAGGYTGNPVSENAQAIIGAPMTNSSLLGGSAGAAYIVSERTPTGPETTLDEEDSTTSAAPNAAANRANLNYPIGLYELNDGWATVRNKYAQFVMGHAAGGSLLDADGYEHQWLHGKVLYPTVRRCGWIDRKNIPLSGRLGDNLDPNACKKGPRYVPPRYFARLMNCDNCSDGTEVKVLNRPGDNHWPIYRNVHPGTREHRHDLVARLRANALVRWRYISRSGRFVLITVRRASDGSEPQLASGSLGGARWGFISRDALPRAFGPGGLCADRTHGIMATGERQNPNLNPRPDRYVTKDGKRIPLWPPVCKRDGPGAD